MLNTVLVGRKLFDGLLVQFDGPFLVKLFLFQFAVLDVQRDLLGLLTDLLLQGGFRVVVPLQVHQAGHVAIEEVAVVGFVLRQLTKKFGGFLVLPVVEVLLRQLVVLGGERQRQEKRKGQE